MTSKVKRELIYLILELAISNYLNLELVILYTTLSERKMGV